MTEKLNIKELIH